MRQNVLITRGALYGLIVSYVIALFAIGWIVYVGYQLDTERIARRNQVNETLTLACQRENQIAKPSRDLFRFVLQITANTPQSHRFRLVLRKAVRELTPINCRNLPVFK